MDPAPATIPSCRPSTRTPGRPCGEVADGAIGRKAVHFWWEMWMNSMVYGRYNYSYWGLQWIINQQTLVGGDWNHGMECHHRN